MSIVKRLSLKSNEKGEKYTSANMCRKQRFGAEKSDPRKGHKHMTYGLRSRRKARARVFSRHVDGIYGNPRTLQRITPR